MAKDYDGLDIVDFKMREQHRLEDLKKSEEEKTKRLENQQRKTFEQNVIVDNEMIDIVNNNYRQRQEQLKREKEEQQHLEKQQRKIAEQNAIFDSVSKNYRQRQEQLEKEKERKEKEKKLKEEKEKAEKQKRSKKRIAKSRLLSIGVSAGTFLTLNTYAIGDISHKQMLNEGKNYIATNITDAIKDYDYFAFPAIDKSTTNRTADGDLSFPYKGNKIIDNLKDSKPYVVEVACQTFFSAIEKKGLPKTWGAIYCAENLNLDDYESYFAEGEEHFSAEEVKIAAYQRKFADEAEKARERAAFERMTPEEKAELKRLEYERMSAEVIWEAPEKKGGVSR